MDKKIPLPRAGFFINLLKSSLGQAKRRQAPQEDEGGLPHTQPPKCFCVPQNSQRVQKAGIIIPREPTNYPPPLAQRPPLLAN